jgi:hypothetical protein
MNIVLAADPICPFCETSDTVKAFKVGDEHGWWSRCWADHTQYQSLADDAEGPLSEETFTADKNLWFLWLEDEPNTCLIEGPTTGRTIGIVFPT